MTENINRLRVKANFQAPKEIEATLIICSENPRIIVEQIAGLTSIKYYSILAKETKMIHDIYLDTSDNALKKQKLALRLRKLGEKQLITLKGPSRHTNWGGVERLEIEELWSENSLNIIVKELMDKKIKILQKPKDLDFDSPLDIMLSLGFGVVQDRETHRKARDIVKDEKRDAILAELAVDSVIYHLSNQDVCHYEVEIESKANEGIDVIKTVKEFLLEEYKHILREWRYGKFTTGKVIEKLLSAKKLEGLINVNKNLKPIAYDKVYDYLKL